MEHLESGVADIVLVSARKVVDANQQTVIHNVESRQQLHISLHLLHKLVSFLGSNLQLAIPVDPIEILLRCAWVVVQFFIADRTAQGRALQVKGFVDISVRREDIAHDNKVNLLSMRQLDSMEAKEATQKRVWVLFDVLR